ncbi:YdeI/OmpD-associated family protein [Phycicoccus avicenniae]|uniref:YdeI/OmpD-associated family protein n=1 Tax=Phycicoccus avicenniae TaxID=2828860 RepID=UPI003D29D773
MDDDLALAARHARTRRVHGALEGVAVNVGVNRADVIPHSFVYVGRALLRRLDARPGDLVSCRLRPVDPDEVPIPDDVREALIAADVLAGFESLSPPRRRQLLRPVLDASSPRTRLSRIEALIRSPRS